MFKARLEIRTSCPLSGSKSKQLQQKLSSRYSRLDSHIWQIIIPTRQPTLSMEKTTTSAVIYSQMDPEKEPVIFDANGKGDLYLPTLYTVWRYPDTLRRILVPANIYSNLLSGADVMVPGLQPGSDLDGVKIGEAVAIYATQNPHAFAIGVMIMDENGLGHCGGKGKCIKTYHVYGDSLWKYGHQSRPNSGFIDNGISSLFIVEKSNVQEEKTPQLEDDQPHDPEAVISSPILDMRTAIEDALIHVLQSLTSETSSLPLPICNLQSRIMAMDERFDIKLTSFKTWDVLYRSFAKRGTIKVKDVDEQTSVVSINLPANIVTKPAEDIGDEQCHDRDEVDETIRRVLISTLSHHVLDSDLPITASILSDRMRASTSNELQIKSSSYKTFTKLFRSFTKDGVIKVKEHNAILSITFVNRSHPTLSGDVPVARSRDTPTAKKAPSKVVDASKIRIITMYEPMKRIRFLFGGVPGHDLLLMGDAKAKLMEYVVREGLKESEGRVKLDPVLANALWHDVAEQKCPTIVTAKELSDRFERQLVMHTAVLTGPDQKPVFKKGVPPTIEITVEKVGQKLRTRLRNLEPFGINPAELAQHAQKKFASATAVKPLPGKTSQSQYEVFIQGKVDKEVAAYLKAEMKVPLHLITIIRKDVK